jgi:hypothetical protein
MAYDISHTLPSSGSSGLLSRDINNRIVSGPQKMIQAFMVAVLSDGGPVERTRDAFYTIIMTNQIRDNGILAAEFSLLLPNLLAQVNDYTRPDNEIITNAAITNVLYEDVDKVSLVINLTFKDGNQTSYEQPVLL